MLATLGELPDAAGWAYEFKWDGVRAVVYTGPAGWQLFSRNDRDITSGYPDLAGLEQVIGGRRLILDGELVALDEHDRPSFCRLQQRMHVSAPSLALLTEVPVIFQVFDILDVDGEPVLHEPYEQRRERLIGLGLAGDTVRVPPHFTGVSAGTVVAAAQACGLEGVMAKRLSSPYRPGRRSQDWIKKPFSPTQEVVIVGYKPGEGHRSGTIGSLVLAVQAGDGSLAYAGGVGTGFTAAMLHDLHDLHDRLRPLARPDPPLSGVPRPHARGVHWVEPRLVGEVAYRNWTPDGRLRHPSWRGLRADKAPADVHRAPTAPPSREVVEAAMRTPDGQWRVEVVRRGTSRWYRIVHGDDQIDWLSIEGVERILDTAGVDRGTLAPADPAPADPVITPPADSGRPAAS
jgi:bifunctional non-homologous end joining protein LigD